MTVTDLSDDGDTGDGDTGDDPTVTPIEADPAIEVTKMATVVQNDGNTTTDVGDEIQYTITVENIGNVTVAILDSDNDGFVSINLC